MTFSYEEQKFLYKNYWIKIEAALKNGSMDEFFYDYLIYKRFFSFSVNGKKTHLTRSKLYYGFRRYYDNIYPGTSSFERAKLVFDDMLEAALMYRNLLFSEDTMYSKFF